jgi:hypothetical protein
MNKQPNSTTFLTTRTLGIVVAAFAAQLAACTATDVGGPMVEVQNDQPRAVGGYEGYTPRSRALPQVQTLGGSVIAQPHVVPIFFAGDAREAKVTGLFTALSTSTFWKDAMADYGVGTLSVEPVSGLEPEFAPSLTDDDLQLWLKSQIGKSVVPTFDPQTVYAVFLPEHAVVYTDAGHTCLDFDTYHGELTLADARVPYMVVASCTVEAQDPDALTRKVSSLLVNTVANPFPKSAPAFAAPDPRGMGWFMGGGAEVADRCSGEAKTGLVDGFSVARTWSNAAAQAGREPCLPAPKTPYFNAEPVFPDMKTFTVGSETVATPVLKIGVDEQRTIEVDAFAEAKMSWTMEAKDAATLAGREPELVFSFDDASAAPFKVRKLTVRRVQPSSGGVTPFVIVSTAGGTSHSWWGLATE